MKSFMVVQHLVGMVNLNPMDQVWIYLVLRTCHTQARPRVYLLKAHLPHELLDPLAIDLVSLFPEPDRNPAAAIDGSTGVLLV
jgi:hypothetical protein